MENEAIQEDVSVDPRSQRLEEIATLRQQERIDELQDEEDAEEAMNKQADALRDELEAMGEADPEEVDTEFEEEPEEPPKPASPVFEKDGQFYTRIKVNGIEQEVPFDKVLSNAQKNEAADLRLQEAHQRMQELQNYEQMLKEREQQIQLPPKGVDEDLKSLIAKQREALMDGDDEEYEKLTIEIYNKGRQPATPQINPQQLEQIAERKYRQIQTQNEMKEADRVFAEQFADIQNDPDLMTVATRYVHEIRNENPTVSPRDLVTEAGNRTRKWLQQKTGQTTKDQTVERKRKTSAVRSASASKPGKPPEKPKTREDTIEEMRASRSPFN